MAKSARPAPSLIPAVLALIVLIVLGYVLFADLQPSRTEHTVSPPIEIEEPDFEIETVEPVEPAEDRQAVIEQEADEFVNTLAPESNTNSITLSGEQGEFVRHDGTIIIPKTETRQTSIDELKADKTLKADTHIDLSYTETNRQESSLAKLNDEIDDKNQLITIENADGTERKAPLIEFLNDENVDAEKAITLIERKDIILSTTIGELDTLKLSPEQSLTAVIDKGSIELSVKDITQADDFADNALFYMHKVTERDTQGLWGIIQTGLIKRFRQGLQLEGIGINKNMVQVTIPADADEPLPTGLSSFLGKILNNKVKSSYVYNYTTSTMGHDPNLIHPGQQVILIHFTAEELKRIYQFFADQRSEQAQSFSIN
ncbi:MAG TPA: hypothetical protein ENI26_00340 [Methylophaga aminisulfidivorans]|uniref:Uncharacterized protein n=1 Tax=Methylophaga aminisulfidivorans TaxID=230105 RepID=A0A7C1VY03_9GAMM|nr:hypothetical protein [Methylophaga aminisulfidivorans]